ncbi:hypothetical protein DSO57_1016403 [Entomophthora muscae]|uniref:Uncharacterized protein n=1 Tax=Entomophthora muscae TaxID=34485 RepID=A0ACC2RVY4_9FUNG|nr:hypothetical protein DSO57_1016403 [Entomophthora muscae]
MVKFFSRLSIIPNSLKPSRGVYYLFSTSRILNTEPVQISLEQVPLSRLDLEFKDNPFELPLHLQDKLTPEKLPFLLRIQKLDVPRRLETELLPKLPRLVSEEWLEKDDIRMFKLRLFLPTKYDDPEYLQQEMVRVYRKLLRESLKFVDERAR